MCGGPRTTVPRCGLRTGAAAPAADHIHAVDSAVHLVLPLVDQGQIVSLAAKLPGNGRSHFAGSRYHDPHGRTLPSIGEVRTGRILRRLEPSFPRPGQIPV